MARILHIEDEPANRLLVRKILVAAGHEVVDAATGLEGTSLAATSRPDLVLVDINLPGLDGYEVTLRLRGMEGLARVPIVAITGAGDRDTSRAVGCDGFLAKPIDARTFVRVVEAFIRKGRERSEAGRPDLLRQQSQRIVARLEDKVRQLSDAKARLEEVARLRQEFYRNISHELATPLTPVVGYLRLLRDEELGTLGDEQRRALAAVDAGVDRLRGLIDTLLDVTSLETGHMRFTDVDYDFGRVVSRAVDTVRPRAAGRSVALTVGAVPAHLAAFGDPSKIERALVHVLDNAIKFTRDRIGVEVGREGDGYVMRVADDGPGIPGHQLERIFEAFYQVDGSVTREHGGVGLGLAFARRIAEAMGGGIALESPPSRAVAGGRYTGTLVSVSVGRHAPARLDR